jgi:hypothetical protein
MATPEVCYAASKTFYKVFKKVCDRILSSAGWRRSKMSAVAYYRKLDDGGGFLRCWVQLSAWGNREIGNAFTLNSDFHAHDPDAKLEGASQRFLAAVMSREDKEAAERLGERLRARKPEPGPDSAIMRQIAAEPDKEEELRAWLRNPFGVLSSDLLNPNVDIWLEYYSEEDVAEWAAFLAPRLPMMMSNAWRLGLVNVSGR